VSFLGDGAAVVSRMWLWAWRGWHAWALRTGDDGDTVSEPDQREHLRVTIAHIRQLLDVAASEGLDKDLLQGLNTLANRRAEIEKAVIVWVDLVEVLVRETEKRYGAKAGLGRLKSAEVKEAVRFLLRRFHLKLPNVPEVLEPVVVDLAASWIIDALVQIFNRYGLWDTTNPSPTATARVFMFLRSVWRGAIWPLLSPLVRLFVRIWERLRVSAPISPELRAALDAIEREGLIVKQQELIEWFVELFRWIGSHRKSILAIIEVVFTAVQEAEKFADMTGPEKKAFARDLVLAVLDNLGFVQRGGLLFAIIDSLIGSAIESAVHIFNKHNAFPRGDALT
jgi:hypothetical protein